MSRAEPGLAPVTSRFFPEARIFAEGFASVWDLESPAMIALRARPETPGLEKAIHAATALPVPPRRTILAEGLHAAAWMAPDEYLLFLPQNRLAEALAAIESALAGQAFLAADVSDARLLLRVEGAKAAQVLAKLTPADIETLPEGELRRSRLGQIAAGFWREGTGFNVMVFRSFAGYARALLANAAREGTELE